MLAADRTALDSTTMKIRDACLEDLRYAARSGCMTWALYSLLKTIALLMMGDIQNTEGLGNVLKALGK
eukprot:9520439-Alexandrium_andersonii.AAC.1